MTLQTSGAITLAQIQTEFGGSNPISLNEYYAGGPYVPTGTSGTNGPVPASGTISVSNFYGTSAITLVDSQSITQGVGPTFGTPPYGPFTTGIGYNSSFGPGYGTYGSITDGTSNTYSGATIRSFSYLEEAVFFDTYNYTSYFAVDGSVTNSNTAWRYLTDAANTVWVREDALFTSNSTVSYWNWLEGEVGPSQYVNPAGTIRWYK